MEHPIILLIILLINIWMFVVSSKLSRHEKAIKYLAWGLTNKDHPQHPDYNEEITRILDGKY